MAEQNRGTEPQGDGQAVSLAGSQGMNQGDERSRTASQPRGVNGAPTDADDERRGEGGYGNDTGFATGSVAPRDDEGESGREEQIRERSGGTGGQG